MADDPRNVCGEQLRAGLVFVAKVEWTAPSLRADNRCITRSRRLDPRRGVLTLREAKAESEEALGEGDAVGCGFPFEAMSVDPSSTGSAVKIGFAPAAVERHASDLFCSNPSFPWLALLRRATDSFLPLTGVDLPVDADRSGAADVASEDEERMGSS